MALKEKVPFTASNGAKSWYHIWENGATGGFMYYFDGDYWRLSESDLNVPSRGMLDRLSKVAAEKNLMLVAVNSPDTNASGDGITWWENITRNGVFFRELHKKLTTQYPTVNGYHVWFVGYSGGAEFITYELANKGVDNWKTGGAVIVGGGGADAPVATTTRAKASKAGVVLRWVVGDRDRSGATNPPTWSAWDAAHEGQAAYMAAGFRTELQVIPGVNHLQYDIPSYVADIPKVTASNVARALTAEQRAEVEDIIAGRLSEFAAAKNL